VSELLAHNADVNAATSDTGSTSLMLAAEGGHLAVVSKLLEHHADVNVATTDTGSTPLILASWNGHKEIIRLLCQNGAHKNTINKDGRRAIDLAKTIEIKRILSESCPSVKPTETLPEGGYSRRPKTKRNRRNKRTKRIARK
jgi:ankyrin repeat protein